MQRFLSPDPAEVSGGGAGLTRFHPIPPGSSELQPRRTSLSVVTMRELLEAGVHFGHQTRRWNPKMRRYIFT